jgi:hypothetical protein
MHRKQYYFRILLLFCLVLIVSACSAQNNPIPVPSILAPSTTYLASVPTLSSTQDIVPTVNPTRRFTFTPSPSQTSTINIPTITVPVNLHASSSTELAVSLRATLIASFPIICKDDNSLKYHSSLSPDGNWLAISCSYSKVGNLEIVNHSGKRWLLQYEDHVPEEFKGGSGSLDPIHWLNSDYLYFTSNPGISVWGPCLYISGRSLGLYRIDLHKGNVSATLPPLTNPSYSIAFSPNGRKLAYIGAWSHTAILDLRTSEEETVETKDNYVGNLTWSPDGSKLAYASCQTNQDYSALVKSYIKVYSVDTHVSKTILEEQGKLLGIDVENADSFLKIAEDQYLNHPTYLWFYDWSSGQFVTPDQTPTPSP